MITGRRRFEEFESIAKFVEVIVMTSTCRTDNDGSPLCGWQSTRHVQSALFMCEDK